MEDRGRIGIVGAGLVGSSWAVVFARAGFDVHVYDSSDVIRAGVAEQCRESLARLAQEGLLREDANDVARRIRVVPTLREAVAGARYVQESVREDLDAKTGVARDIAEALDDDATVGSSTSGFPASAFTADLERRARFLVVHPVNPPHLVPVVEIVPAPWTATDAIEAARELMTVVGQRPVTVRREIDGFILNRLQGALLDEAWRLYAGGYASIEDIDATISHGLGMRWSFIGPFETIDLNAPEGLADYAERLAPMYRRIADTRPAVEPWDADAVAAAHAERRAAVPAQNLADRRAWRDDMLLRFLARFREQ